MHQACRRSAQPGVYFARGPCLVLKLTGPTACLVNHRCKKRRNIHSKKLKTNEGHDMISHCIQLDVSPFVRRNLSELKKQKKQQQKHLLRKVEWSSTQQVRPKSTRMSCCFSVCFCSTLEACGEMEQKKPSLWG